MQYLVSVIDDKTDSRSTDRQSAIDAFNERLIAGGYWVFAGGLADTDAAEPLGAATNCTSHPRLQSALDTVTKGNADIF